MIRNKTHAIARAAAPDIGVRSAFARPAPSGPLKQNPTPPQKKNTVNYYCDTKALIEASNRIRPTSEYQQPNRPKLIAPTGSQSISPIRLTS